MADHPKKALLVCEYRQGKLLESTYELLAFADVLAAERIMLLVGSEEAAPKFAGKVYLADPQLYGEFNPDLHKRLIVDVVQREHPDYILFLHSPYGWDLAPRVAAALKAAQVSEIIGVRDGNFEVPSCNAKLRRLVSPRTAQVVLTIQSGTFNPHEIPVATPQFERMSMEVGVPRVEFIGYEAAEKKGVDLAKAEVIVSAGRGIGKKENVEAIASLA
ncbi:MAG: electron transfer flavoprotein subunit alpha/FixB family protein, partial [Anaerolineales bacterium]